MNELKLLSVVARGRPEHRGVLKILSDLDLRYSGDSIPETSDLSRTETTNDNAALFDKLLKDAELGISTSDFTHEAENTGQSRKYYFRGILGLISLTLVLVALYLSYGQNCF